jgi:hypothetical protein
VVVLDGNRQAILAVEKLRGPRRPLLFALGSLRTNRQVDVIGGEVPSAEPIGAAPASRLRETVGALGLELVVTA